MAKKSTEVPGRYDRVLTLSYDGKLDSYVLVDTSKTYFYPGPKRDGFDSVVGFPIKTHPGEGNISIPVVFTDFTTSDGIALEPIEWADVPAPIKRRYTKWQKFQ